MDYRKILGLFCLCMLCFMLIPSLAAAGDGVLILCYHDVGKALNDYTISRETLESHLNYLRQNGYTPISWQQYRDANVSGAPLPSKPVMLTFDDGYAAFYTEVFPLLKKYQYPAVMAVVTSWQEGFKPPDVGPLVTWPQLREMEASGLVTVASHSHELHRLMTANLFGDRGEAGATLLFKDGRYESLDEYKARITKDLAETQRAFTREMGHSADVMVWPYGEYTLFAVDAAKQQGFKALFTLGSGANPPGEKSMWEARRGIVTKNPDAGKFAIFLNRQGDDDPPFRVAWVNPDLIYDPASQRQTDTNLRLLIDRMQKLGITAIFLPTFSTAQDGSIEAMYFQTGVAPVKATVFDHIARRFRDEGIYVYAVLPTLGVPGLADRSETVASLTANNPSPWPVRATPFSENVRTKLRTMATDLAALSFLDGVVFMDDLSLNGAEDFSAPAQEAFQRKFGRPLTGDVLSDPRTKSEWDRYKADTLTDLTQELTQVIRQYRPYARFVRSIYPEAVVAPSDLGRTGQDYSQFLSVYDLTLLVPGPYTVRQTPPTVQGLNDTVEVALTKPGANGKLLVMLQTFDFANKRWLPAKDLKDLTKGLSAKGVRFFGYYPDTMFNDTAVPQPKGN